MPAHGASHAAQVGGGEGDLLARDAAGGGGGRRGGGGGGGDRARGGGRGRGDGAKDVAWQYSFALLEAYKVENGNSNPPSSSSLGQWAGRQRGHFKGGTLSQDRFLKLAQLDFFSDTPSKDDAWEARLRMLEEYKYSFPKVRAISLLQIEKILGP